MIFRFDLTPHTGSARDLHVISSDTSHRKRTSGTLRGISIKSFGRAASNDMSVREWCDSFMKIPLDASEKHHIKEIVTFLHNLWMFEGVPQG